MASSVSPELVSAIKDLQRSDTAAKQQWWAYCDALGGGIRDPAKHDATFIQTFLSKYNSGQRFEPAFPTSGGSGGGGHTNLGELFKEGQRRSQHWKNCWALYCQQFSGGKNDPEKKDMNFLVGFYDFLGSSGNMEQSPSAANGGGGAMAAPSAKRARTDSNGGYQALPAGDNPTKDVLVARIKDFQRSGEEAKQAWWSHCDQLHNGVRDPARHEVEDLEEFCENFSVP
eukprot:CAMPEP_0171094498 /NCGR_PEP_ID=MMETSP0766_2-20121228/41337_1 /TAXON_ID=439317 /ORGANISM="Gambierdiscus australes, Strain CAWD 149" /LENGTH=227 /DNA_ID=CAMNT_0011553149 /DNA_START=71 /DNA_END=754 /DNA_ORIENTATION=-